MRQTLGNVRSDVLLIFDEIENISPRTAASQHWRAGRDTVLFWQTLRAFFQREGKHKLTFCFVGTNPHLFEMPRINDIDNPVYLFAPTTFLQPLSSIDVQTMCSRLGYFMGLDFDLAVVNHIHRRYGGHPFFVRQLCSRIHQLEPLQRPVAVSLDICSKAEAGGAAAVRGYVREILGGLKEFYPEEYELLRYLARGDIENFNSIASAYPEFVEHLMGYGVLIKRGEAHEFLFDAVKDAMLSIEGDGKSSDNKWDEVSARRNKVEEEIRTVLFHWASQLPAEDWAAACDACIPRQVERMGRLGQRDFFSRNQSPLYLLDLLAFVKYSGRYASNLSLQSEISRAFDVVNKLRIDAHAKGISEEEYGTWNSAMTILEDNFLPPP